MPDKEPGNKHLVNLHGIQFHITGNPASREARRRIHLAKLDMAELKKTHPGLNIARLERPGLYEIKSIHGIDQVRMTIPEVPKLPIGRRPVEIDLIASQYRLAFMAYSYEGEFQGLVLTGGLTWQGPYTFLSLNIAGKWGDEDDFFDPFWWGAWSGIVAERPYEADPRPSKLLKSPLYEGDSEVWVVYPWHDCQADSVEWEAGSNESRLWAGGGYHDKVTWTLPRVSVFCCRSVIMNNMYTRQYQMPNSCTGKNVFTITSPDEHQSGTFVHKGWSLDIYSADAIQYYYDNHEDDVCVVGDAPVAFNMLNEREATVVYKYDEIRPWSYPWFTTYLTNGKGGALYGVARERSTVRKTVTPLYGLPDCAAFPLNCEEYSTVTTKPLVQTWTEEVVCDGTIYGAGFGQSAYYDKSDVWPQDVLTQYFKMGEHGLLAMAIRRKTTNNWDYWLFSPSLEIEEAEVRFDYSHSAMGNLFQLLPVKGPGGINLYASGEFELIREVTPSKIQAGEV